MPGIIEGYDYEIFVSCRWIDDKNDGLARESIPVQVKAGEK